MSRTPTRLAAVALGITVAASLLLLITASGAAFLVAFNPQPGGIPTSTPDETITTAAGTIASAEPVTGRSRSNPAPVGSIASTENWSVQMLSQARGADAAAFAGTDIPLEPDKELLVVEMRVTGRDGLGSPVALDGRSFALAGDRNVRYDTLDLPATLEVDVGAGDTVEGLLFFPVASGESDLILEFRPLAVTGVGDDLFLAVTPGAVPRLAAITEPIDPAAGQTPDSAVVPGVWVSTDAVAARVTGTIAGPAARQFMLTELGGDLDDVEDEAEYIAVNVEVINVSGDTGFLRVDPRRFTLSDEATGVVLDQYVEPPILDARLYPTGRADGWLVIELRGDGIPMLVLDGFRGSAPRYLRLASEQI